MTAQKSDKKHNRSLAARIGRVLLYTLCILLALLLIISVGINIYLTDARLEKIAAKYTAQAIPRQLLFKTAHFNIFNGFVFNDIQLVPLDSTVQDSFPLTSATIDKAVLRYNLRQVFKKRIVISNIELLKPHLKVNLLETISTPDTLIVNQVEAEADTSTQILSMPLSVDLQKFSLSNLAVHILMQQDSILRDISIDRLNLALDNIQIPNGDVLSQIEQLQGDLRFSLDDAKLQYSESTASQQTISAAVALSSHLFAHLASLDSIPVTFELLAKDINLHLPDIPELEPDFPITLKLDILADAEKFGVKVNNIDLLVEKQTWLSMQGYAASDDSVIYFDAQIEQGKIPLAQILNQIADNLPLSIPEYYLHHPEAAFSFSGTRLSGSFKDATENTIHAEFGIALDPFGITVNNGEHILQNLQLSARAVADVENTAPVNFSGNVSVQFDSVFITLPDSTTHAIGKSELVADALLNDKFVPVHANLKLLLQNVFDAKVNGDFHFSGTNSMQSLAGGGVLSIQHFSTEQLPGSPAATSVNADIKMDMQSLHDVKTQIDVTTDSIRVSMEQQAFTFPPLNFNTKVDLAANANFDKFSIDSCTFALNDLIIGALSADVNTQDPMSVNSSLQNIKISHQPVLSLVPEHYLAGMEELNLDGESILGANLAVSLEDSADIDADFVFNISRMNVDWPPAQIRANGISLALNGNYSHMNGAHLFAEIGIDSALVEQLRPGYLFNNSIKIYAHSPDFTTFKLDSALLDIPTLNINGYADADIVDSAIPSVKATVIIEHLSETPVQIIPDIAVRGQARLVADISIDSTHVEMLGTVFTDSLDMHLGSAHIIGIDTDMHINQCIDLTGLTLLSDNETAIQTQTASLMDYYMHQDYFYEANLQQSNVRIDTIRFGEYSIENMRMIGYLGNGMLDVPLITMDMLTGSIGGRLQADARNKTPQQTAVDLSLHFSDINSALLLPPEAKSHTRGKIRANSELHGTGFNFDEGADIQGFFYITQIQPRAADNLLRTLDPEEKDSGVRWTRFLINRGFKPKIFAFEIRNGYCYPSVSFIQPWYFPVRLSSSKIELARIPLAYFFTQ